MQSDNQTIHFMGVILFLVVTIFVIPTAWGSTPELISTIAGATGESIGHAAGMIPDIDQDGFGEIVTGSVTLNEVRLQSGKTGTLIWKATGNNPGDWFGQSLRAIPDVTGDGISDIFVGAPQINGGIASGPGYVRLLSGKDGSTVWTRFGLFTGDYFGWSVDGVGDLDKDGVYDLIVGSPYSDVVNANNAGSVHIISGKDGHSIKSFFGEQNTLLGWSVKGLGDITGEGIPEFAAGAPLGIAGTDTAKGQVQVYMGHTLTKYFSLKGDKAVAWFGYSIDVLPKTPVSPPKIVVGSPFFDPDTKGKISVFDLVSKQLIWSKAGYTDSLLGFSLANAGDVDNDGIPDVVGGAPGWNAGIIQFRSGKDGSHIKDIFGTNSNYEFGKRLLSVNEPFGKNVATLIVSSPKSNGIIWVMGHPQKYAPVKKGP